MGQQSGHDHASPAHDPSQTQPMQPSNDSETGVLEEVDRFLPHDLGHLAPDDPNQPHTIGNPHQRSQSLLQMQRRYGNAYVQRMLAGQTDHAASSTPVGAIQRYNPTTTNVSTGTKDTFKTPKKDIKLNKGIPKLPVKLASIGFSAEINYSTESAGAGQGSPTAAKAGQTVQPQGVGFQGELMQKWEEWQTDSVGKIGVSSKATGKIGMQGGEIGVEPIGVQFERATFALKFNILSYSAEKSQVEFPNMTFQVGVLPIKGEGTASDGSKYKYEIKPILEFKFEPNYEEIGKWLAQRFGTQAAAELGVAGGIVLAGVATIAAAVVTASLGSEVRERVELSIKYTNEFCDAYQMAVREAKSGGGTSQWAAAGSAAGMKLIEQAKDKVPPEALKEEAQKRDLRSEAFAIAFPQIREALLQNYREEHYVEWWVYGEDGPGYKILKRLLGSPEHLRF